VLYGPIPECPHQALSADGVKKARPPGAHHRDSLPATTLFPV